ncbi:lipase family protein [Nocardia sp. NPDC051030]|uniref:lipase family protein n=1 Tax=Nocardia sp. NPDC051030 TaxID=3155162 RepID=UPI00343D7D95
MTSIVRMVCCALVTAATLGSPTGPASAAESTPGTVITAIPQPAGWRGMNDGTVIDYWMTGIHGELQPASGALFVPAGPPPPAGWPIIAYDHGTSGLGPGCGEETTADAPPVRGVMSDWVAQGFAVVAPDYLGLGRFDTGPHPYLGIHTEATATIDLVRAARAARPELSRTWAVFGGSQGGQAALGAGNLQASYAPELDFRGTIAVDPESDLEKVLPIAAPSTPTPLDKWEATGLIAGMLTGLNAAHPELNVDSYLSPHGRELIATISRLCFPDIFPLVEGVSIGDLLSRPLADSTFDSTLTHYMAVPTTGYNAPILLLLNATDLVVPSPFHATLAAQLTANAIDFQTVVGVNRHTQLDHQMRDALSAFITRIFAAPALT